MFAKLLKHEWNSSRKIMTILTLSMLAMGLLATLCLRLLIGSVQNMVNDDNPFMILLMVGLGMFLFACYMAALVYVVAVQFILLYRFYKNKYTDEGYLTFTLPVKVTDIFWSSFLNMLIWTVISAVVLVTVLLGVILFGTATDGIINTEILAGLGEIFKLFADLPWEMLIDSSAAMVVLIIIYVLQMLISPISGLILPMACITIGAMLAKKHKILASFGVYFAASTVVSIVMGVVSTVPLVFFINADTGTGYYILSGLLNLAVTVAMTIGGYFLTTHLMKNKLNLP